MISMQQDRKTALQSFFYSWGMDMYKMLPYPHNVKMSDIVGTFISFTSKRVVGLKWLWFNLGWVEKYQFSRVKVFR